MSGCDRRRGLDGGKQDTSVATFGRFRQHLYDLTNNGENIVLSAFCIVEDLSPDSLVKDAFMAQPSELVLPVSVFYKNDSGICSQLLQITFSSKIALKLHRPRMAVPLAFVFSVF